MVNEPVGRMKNAQDAASLAEPRKILGVAFEAAMRLLVRAVYGLTLASTLLVPSHAAGESAPRPVASSTVAPPPALSRSTASNASSATNTLPVLSAQDAAAVQALREFLARSTSAQGTFEQRIVRDGASKDAQSSGRYRFQRPGRYAWITDQPYPQSIFSDGRTLQVFDPALNQLTLRPAASGDAAAATGTPVDLLFGRLPPGQDPLAAWRIESATAPPGARRYEPATTAWRWIKLEPRQPSAANSETTAYQNVVLGLSAGVPQWLSFDDAMGQHLQLRLHWQLAATFAITDFRIEPPPGVEVIDLRPTH